ncbi:hypothetical protein ROTAS13_03231 [Roseomonas sp. TAS13]|jgi:hypothetical protein|uniref:Uncharacterized protein n=1 Tax=Muricoccus pecuniae TaxID=693023 RepID=A0A840YLZ4_9PROT|nr:MULTISPECIES: hypothetical protein [Roseomonas]ATR19256.1 hypothetical protein CTJ15_02510 [Roseomonas sp. FDAARGOS_362]MBB5695893.1 hypothetical protein [Roseomonas pecuniae]USQ74504.1 hypothetical protein NF552_25370 [Roseomonas mucosa]GAV35554.1 hypothetical protein ROTAS13_03231 [Roseomonas sp. TAS13]
MDFHALPILGISLVLNDDAGNGLALGTSSEDPAYLLAVVEDAAGRAIICNLIDGESEALLLAMLTERAAVRAAAAIPPYRATPGAAGASS